MKETEAYRLKNGILYMNGKAKFGIGSHYYPSYHPKKVPVPENGDRLGEMKRDLAEMKAARVNIVRTAAIGDFTLGENGYEGSFPLGKAIAEETGKLGIALVVRLNGYDNGLNEYPDEKMTDENGKPLKSSWSQFITNSVCHDGAKRDNEKVTEIGAEFFGGYENVVGFQIFNEPAFPHMGFYDYNPSTIEKYRESLLKKGVSDEGNFENAEPPRKRPTYSEDPEKWIDWRLFNAEKFNDYLNFLADTAKKRKKKAETFTCMTCCPVQIGSSMRGADYFRVAEKMDIVGITMYLDCRGAFYYEQSRVMDYAESAAAAFGKHYWLIEYDARADMTGREFEAETYAAIGSGVKGIMYYQWRGDYAFDDSPEPNGFGMVYNDGTPTKKYDSAMKMHEMLFRLGDKIVCKERVRQGVGILHSEHANAYYDAICNGDNKRAWSGKESNIFSAMGVYRKFKREFVSLIAVRASELNNLPFELNALIIPAEKGLSEEEIKQIEAFKTGGGKVFYYDLYLDSFKPYDFSGRWFEVYEIVDLYGKKIASVNDRKVDLKFLEDEKEYAVSVIDFAEEEREIENLEVDFFAKTSGKTCIFAGRDGNDILPVEHVGGGCYGKAKVVIPKLKNGGIIFINKG